MHLVWATVHPVLSTPSLPHCLIASLPLSLPSVIVLVDAIKTLALKFKHKYKALMGFLASALREEGGLPFKQAIVNAIIAIFEAHPEALETVTLYTEPPFASYHCCVLLIRFYLVSTSFFLSCPKKGDNYDLPHNHDPSWLNQFFF